MSGAEAAGWYSGDIDLILAALRLGALLPDVPGEVMDLTEHGRPRAAHFARRLREAFFLSGKVLCLCPGGTEPSARGIYVVRFFSEAGVRVGCPFCSRNASWLAPILSADETRELLKLTPERKWRSW